MATRSGPQDIPDRRRPVGAANFQYLSQSCPPPQCPLPKPMRAPLSPPPIELPPASLPSDEPMVPLTLLRRTVTGQPAESTISFAAYSSSCPTNLGFVINQHRSTAGNSHNRNTLTDNEDHSAMFELEGEFMDLHTANTASGDRDMLPNGTHMDYQRDLSSGPRRPSFQRPPIPTSAGMNIPGQVLSSFSTRRRLSSEEDMTALHMHMNGGNMTGYTSTSTRSMRSDSNLVEDEDFDVQEQACSPSIFSYLQDGPMAHSLRLSAAEQDTFHQQSTTSDFLFVEAEEEEQQDEEE